MAFQLQRQQGLTGFAPTQVIFSARHWLRADDFQRTRKEAFITTGYYYSPWPSTVYRRMSTASPTPRTGRQWAGCTWHPGRRDTWARHTNETKKKKKKKKKNYDSNHRPTAAKEEKEKEKKKKRGRPHRKFYNTTPHCRTKPASKCR